MDGFCSKAMIKHISDCIINFVTKCHVFQENRIIFCAKLQTKAFCCSRPLSQTFNGDFAKITVTTTITRDVCKLFKVKLENGNLKTGSDPEMDVQIIDEVCFMNESNLYDLDASELHNVFTICKSFEELLKLNGYVLFPK